MDEEFVSKVRKILIDVIDEEYSRFNELDQEIIKLWVGGIYYEQNIYALLHGKVFQDIISYVFSNEAVLSFLLAVTVNFNQRIYFLNTQSGSASNQLIRSIADGLSSLSLSLDNNLKGEIPTYLTDGIDYPAASVIDRLEKNRIMVAVFSIHMFAGSSHILTVPGAEPTHRE